MLPSAPVWKCMLLAAAFAPLAGCTTVLKQAYYEVRGAKARVVMVEDRDPALLEGVKSVRFEPATTLIGPKITPPALLRAYDAAVQRVAGDLRKEAYPGGEPALTVRSDMIYAQTKGLMSGALCLTRVRMTADDGGALDVLVKAESKSFRAGGEDDLASAAAEALGRFLREKKRIVDDD